MGKKGGWARKEKKTPTLLHQTDAQAETEIRHKRPHPPPSFCFFLSHFRPPHQKSMNGHLFCWRGPPVPAFQRKHQQTRRGQEKHTRTEPTITPNRQFCSENKQLLNLFYLSQTQTQPRTDKSKQSITQQLWNTFWGLARKANIIEICLLELTANTNRWTFAALSWSSGCSVNAPNALAKSNKMNRKTRLRPDGRVTWDVQHLGNLILSSYPD